MPRILLTLLLLGYLNGGQAACLAEPDRHPTCRTPANDGWCAQNERGKPYAHDDACLAQSPSKSLKRFSGATTAEPVRPPAAAPVRPPASLAIPPRFQPFLKPNRKITMGRCHMGECSWSQWLSVTPLEVSNDELLLQVVLRGASSSHPEGNYPNAWHRRLKLDWNPSSHEIRVLCSYRRPLVYSPGETPDRDAVLPLHPEAGIPGVMESAVNLYLEACHSHFVLEPVENTLRRYRYAVTP